MDSHFDGNGCERTPNRWGFNSFRHQKDAEQTALRGARPDTTWHIWRLADGTYDYTHSPEPNLPGYPAELVNTVHRPGRKARGGTGRMSSDAI